MTRSKHSESQRCLYYRHSLPVRIMHWLAVISLPVLLMSGLDIFNANPELHWGKSSYTGSPPVLEIRGRKNGDGDLIGVTRIFGHEFTTTGFLGASKDSEGKLESRGFPSWLTIPGDKWLSMARRWHLFFAWAFGITSVYFIGYSLFSRHLHRDLMPTKQDWRSISATLRDHLFLRHPTGDAAKNYNVMQKLAYLGVIFFLFPLVVINGLGMSPGIDALFPGWVDLFGGRQAMRTIHFIISWALVAFTFIHLFQVGVTGFWNNIRSMITGNYLVEFQAVAEIEPETVMEKEPETVVEKEPEIVAAKGTETENE